jgi:hypothetical protein
VLVDARNYPSPTPALGNSRTDSLDIMQRSDTDKGMCCYSSISGTCSDSSLHKIDVAIRIQEALS